MAFDLNTAQPLATGGFDVSTAATTTRGNTK